LNFIYNILIALSGILIKLAALFNPKLRLFVEGRKNIFDVLIHQINPEHKIIWFHAASLGEFEQGLPVMETIKKDFPDYLILVTFFSPSGYEIKKNHKLPDIITYLPLDTPGNAQRFVSIVKPSLAVFIKYEFWPNFLNELSSNKIPVIAIAAIFRKNQIFFKFYGGFMRKTLNKVNHFFVQDENSIQLLKSLGIKNSTLSGDTRFDRVSEILERDNTLDFVEEFKQNQLCLVAGSTWPEDEQALIAFINQTDATTKFIIAPHTIKPEKISNLKSQLNKSTVLYSEMKNKNLIDAQVFIVDTIGILTKIYSYAEIAYVGGGLGKTGLHNTLEPAVFGIPVIIGPNYSKFKEARELVNLGGIISIKNPGDLINTLNNLINKEEERLKIGNINSIYIKKNKGARTHILRFIRILLDKKI
jgi:3-deoxy-D-manno-octulosonic-acid transferase